MTVPARSRWVAERTFAWISKHCRTTRDYEQPPASHEAMILWAMIALMTRRLAQPAQVIRHSLKTLAPRRRTLTCQMDTGSGLRAIAGE